jgi:beta-RFAP synthase
MGFLDPSGSLGRPFGSLGLVIDGFETSVELARSDVDTLAADSPAARSELDRAAVHLHRLRERTGLHEPLALRLRGVLPAHAGFGSGTQLALAVATAFTRLHRLAVPTATLAQWLSRGTRSGIGIAGFDTGGLLVDGGPGQGGRPAALTARVMLPAAWRIAVVIDPRRHGRAGRAERDAIDSLPRMPREQAAEICHQVLMGVLPGAAGDDFGAFAAGINRVQDLLGAHFAPAQGGSAWTSEAVGHALTWLREGVGDAAAVGQSSWGPTGFAILPSAAAAQELVGLARAAGVLDPALEVRIVGARSRGAVVEERRDIGAETTAVPPA